MPLKGSGKDSTKTNTPKVIPKYTLYTRYILAVRLMEECWNDGYDENVDVENPEDKFLSSELLRQDLESLPLTERDRVLRFLCTKLCTATRDGAPLLFIACKKGRTKVCEYLINILNADIEQRGFYDETEGFVTPLWCAAASGNVKALELLIEKGANVNALSTTKKTPLHVACIKKLNAELIQYLLEHGADIHAVDVLNKNALHYSIETRYESDTSIVLLQHGADPNLLGTLPKVDGKHDVLQLACIRGNTKVFEYLISNYEYSDHRKADGMELLGTYEGVTGYWERATKLRIEKSLHPKLSMPKTNFDKMLEDKMQVVCLNLSEFTTMEETENMTRHYINIQSFLVCDRILGPRNRKTLRCLYELMSPGDDPDRCFKIFSYAVKVAMSEDLFTFEKYTLSHFWFCFLKTSMNLRFTDVLDLANFVVNKLPSYQSLLSIAPVFEDQEAIFRSILMLLINLFQCLLVIAKTPDQVKRTKEVVTEVLKYNPRSKNGDTLLHISTSPYIDLDVEYIGHHYICKEVEYIGHHYIRIDLDFVKLLIECGADTNSRNNNKSTPLHYALKSNEVNHEVVQYLIDSGAHIDATNSARETPYQFLVASDQAYTVRQSNGTDVDISSTSYILPLQCLATAAIIQNNIPYGELPEKLETYIKYHN